MPIEGKSINNPNTKLLSIQPRSVFDSVILHPSNEFNFEQGCSVDVSIVVGNVFVFIPKRCRLSEIASIEWQMSVEKQPP